MPKVLCKTTLVLSIVRVMDSSEGRRNRCLEGVREVHGGFPEMRPRDRSVKAVFVEGVACAKVLGQEAFWYISGAGRRF